MDEREGTTGPDPEEDGALLSLLREAGGSGADAGAAGRIGDGAWARAAGARAGRRAPSRLLRFAWPAAAAAGFLGAAVAPGRAAPSFAVEGDPVQVWRGERWTAAARAPVALWIRAAGGDRSLVGPGRDVRIRPGPGSLFRILGPFRAEEPWRVEVAGGKVDVEGAAQAFAAGRVRVSPGAGASSLSVGILVPGGGGEGPPAPVDSDPTITVGRGVAELRLLLSGEVLRLAAGEAATVVPGWREERRLAPLGAWEDRDAGTVLLGCPLLDAFPGPGDSLRVVLAPRDGTVRALEIPGDRVAEAVGSLNAAMSILVRRIEAAPGPGPGDLGPRREYRHEREGRVTRILAGGGGPAVLDAAGAFDVFPRLADLRRRRPDAAALFGGLLP